MNSRERFLKTMTFSAPDRPACADYHYYDSTRERWEREGLPKGADLDEYFGYDFNPFRWQVQADIGALPRQKAEVLEETGDYKVIREGDGQVVRILKNEPPPAMPQWLRYPLASREDWGAFKRRLDPDRPGRLPPDLGRLPPAAQRSRPLGLWAGGAYGYMRNWWGVEQLSLLFYDDPALIEEMMEVQTHLYATIFDRVIAARVELDWVMFWEDMAYKTGPLVSPDLYRRFCMPFYRTMMERVRRAGVPVVMLDSDGCIESLIPFWLDEGIFVMHPMEVASGMDVAAARRRYGRRIAFFGGIDKRALAGTRDDIRREVLPKLKACADGGFIAACDHAIPPDVSFDNFRYFRDLIREWRG